MPRGVRMRPADANKLKTLLSERGFSVYGAARELGYTHSGFTSVTRDGMISDRLLVGLKLRFGIDYEDIEPKAEEPEPCVEIEEEKPVTPTVAFEPDWNKIEFIIRRAVAAALQDRGI